MAPSRDPRIIKIIHGEHDVSPHITSLKRDDLGVSHNHIDHKHAHKTKNHPSSGHTPLSMNLIAEDLQKKQHARVKKDDAERVLGSKKIFTAFKKFFTERAPKESTVETPREVVLHAHAHTKKQSRFFSKKHTFAFILLAIAIVTPFKAITTFERLRDAKNNVAALTAHAATPTNFDSVGIQISEALKTFHTTNDSLNEINGAEEFLLRNTPVLGQQYGAARRLVGAGEHVSMAAASYMQLFTTLKQSPDAPLIERLRIFFDGNRAVVRDLARASELVEPIDPTILTDAEQRKIVSETRDAILALHNDAEYLASAGPIILSALGDTTPRRYLLVFQNSSELRPTGGFIGSFALLDIEKGEIKNLMVPAGGSYDLQGTLKKQLYAPLPLHIINTRWEFQDANWFPDFPTSAQKLMWFLEKSQGPSVDGVIAINASVLPKLLEVVGPVVAHNTELTSETALQTVRETVTTANSTDETKTKPKEIISEAAPILIDMIKTSKPEHMLPLVNTLLRSLEQRDIQLYTRDASMQQQIASFGWDGALRTNPHGDFLSINTTNIGGQKTDANITQSIDHQAKIAPDGTVTVTVRFLRTQAESDKMLEKNPNISYVRFYVPRGSTLITAQGFNAPPESYFNAPEEWQTEDSDLKKIEHEVGFDTKSGTRITEEFDHTAFGNWIITEPGGKTEVAISYKLPFKVAPLEPTGLSKIAETLYKSTPAASYSIYLQRQSGAPSTTLTSRVILPEMWKLGWVTDTHAELAENGALLQQPFTNDIHYGLTAHVYATNNTQKEN